MMSPESDVREMVKRKGFTLQQKEGRIFFHLSFAATLSKGKALIVALTAFIICTYLLAPRLGFSGTMAVNRRVAELENKLAKKLSWVLTHKDHIRSHMGNEFHAEVHEDGKKHLLIPKGGVSRLAEALAPDTALGEFDDHYLCGQETSDFTESEVIRKTIALAAITWNSPRSLRHSLNTWQENGLMDIVDEKMIFINRSPSFDDEANLAREFDLDIYTTEEHNGNVMVGPAMAYLVGNSSADYILLMEKDFALSADKRTMMKELYTGVQLLSRGVDAFRLRGKTDYPAEGMPDCCTPAEPPTCPFHNSWRSGGDFSSHQNWLLIFCDPDVLENSKGRAVQCSSDPDPSTICYGSGDSNWSNNPILIRRELLEKGGLHTIAATYYNANNLFEFYATLEWLPWSPPAKVCSSMQGIFTHHEVDQ